MLRSCSRFLAPTALSFAFAASALALSGTASARGGAQLAKKAKGEKDAGASEGGADLKKALSLEEAGEYELALARFRKLGKQKNTPEVQFHTAYCLEKLGQWVKALAMYQDVAESADGEFKSKASKKVDSLEDRIPILTVKRGKGASEVEVSVDGEEIDQASVRKRVRVNPGKHEVIGKLDGEQVFRKQVELEPGGDAKVVVVPKKGAKRAPAAKAGSAAKVGTMPYVLAGVSAVSLVSSLGFFALSKRAADDLDSQCPNGGNCPPRLAATEERGKTMSALGIGTLALGAIGLGVSAYWIMSADSDEKKPKASRAPLHRPRVDVGVAPTRGGWQVGLGGSF